MIRRTLPILLLATATLAPLAGCSHCASQSPAPERGVVALEAPGQTLRVQVEVVRSEEQRAKGLMHRERLPRFGGMLFVFERQELQTFWMKNTYIPLDMIFINEAKVVVGVVHSAAPLTTTSRQVDAPSRYVLEVNGGFAKTYAISAGTEVRFEGIASP